MTCNGDCLRCIYPDCIATDKEVSEFDRAERKAAREADPQRLMNEKDRHNFERRNYYAAHRSEEIERAERWNTTHREQIRAYNRDWMRAYRAKQKEAAL